MSWLAWSAIGPLFARLRPWLVGAALLALILLGIDRCARHQAAAIGSSARQAGAAEQRNTNLTATIKHIEEANNAAQALRRDPAARHDECLRHARNPGDC